jgi:hypothetical protein
MSPKMDTLSPETSEIKYRISNNRIVSRHPVTCSRYQNGDAN